MSARSLSRRARGALIEEARERHAAGEGYKRIGKALGIAPSTVYRWLNPDYAEIDRAKARERQAERRRQAQADPRAAARLRARKRRERKRRKRRVEIAIEMDRRRLERAALSAQLEGSAADAYAFVRRALGQLEASDAATPGARAALRRAQAALYEAEDALVVAARDAG